VKVKNVLEVLNDLPKSIMVLGVKNCEGADLSNVNLFKKQAMENKHQEELTALNNAMDNINKRENNDNND
jgi:hypothetical protein